VGVFVCATLFFFPHLPFFISPESIEKKRMITNAVVFVINVSTRSSDSFSEEPLETISFL